jgi:hypothetical protein
MLSRTAVRFQGCYLLSECIELDDEAPLLLDHACTPCLALMTGLQYLGLLYSSELVFLQGLLRLKCGEVQTSKWCVGTGVWWPKGGSRLSAMSRHCRRVQHLLGHGIHSSGASRRHRGVGRVDCWQCKHAIANENDWLTADYLNASGVVAV